MTTEGHWNTAMGREGHMKESAAAPQKSAGHSSQKEIKSSKVKKPDRRIFGSEVGTPANQKFVAKT